METYEIKLIFMDIDDVSQRPVIFEFIFVDWVLVERDVCVESEASGDSGRLFL